MHKFESTAVRKNGIALDNFCTTQILIFLCKLFYLSTMAKGRPKVALLLSGIDMVMIVPISFGTCQLKMFSKAGMLFRKI
jgi:hypothetical protein